MDSCKTSRRRTPRGFTLIETALTVTIVGVAIVAMCQLLTAGTLANRESSELTTGMTMARNAREFSLKLAFWDPTTPTVWGIDAGETSTNPKTYDDINDMAGREFSPPIDSSGSQLTGFNDWKQKVTVISVDQNLLTSQRPNGTTPAAQITVDVYHKTDKVATLTWFTFYGAP